MFDQTPPTDHRMWPALVYVKQVDLVLLIGGFTKDDLGTTLVHQV